MGQAEILKILNDAYPEWLTFHDLKQLLDLNVSSIYANLNKLVKNNEVDVEIYKIPKSTRRIIKYYKYKNGRSK